MPRSSMPTGSCPIGFAAAIASKILGIPFIISLHGSDIFTASKNALFRAVAKWTFQQSSYVSACSQELCDRAKQINPNINIEVIPWGADPEKFRPLEDRGNVREKYGWSPKELIISTLGRMVHKKGFSQLIDIIPDLTSCTQKFRVNHRRFRSIGRRTERKSSEDEPLRDRVIPGAYPLG